MHITSPDQILPYVSSVRHSSQMSLWQIRTSTDSSASLAAISRLWKFALTRNSYPWVFERDFVRTVFHSPLQISWLETSQVYPSISVAGVKLAHCWRKYDDISVLDVTWLFFEIANFANSFKRQHRTSTLFTIKCTLFLTVCVCSDRLLFSFLTKFITTKVDILSLNLHKSTLKIQGSPSNRRIDMFNLYRRR